MPTYPAGVNTANMAVGPVIDMFGEKATLTVTVSPNFNNGVKHITHTESGYSMVSSSKAFYSDPNTGVATFPAPFTDQVGWQDPSGRLIDVSTKPGWSYTVSISATQGRTPLGSWVKVVQPLQSQTGVIDVDLVGEGNILQGELAPSAIVVSIGGLTGIVTVAQLEALGVGATGNLQMGTVTAGTTPAASVTTDVDGNKLLNLTLVPGPQGLEGPMGRGLQITGRVATRTDLDTLTPVKDDAYITLDTGLLYIYDGATWSEGIPFKGDKGDTGNQGLQGLPGNDGQSAYQVWLNAGNTGTEADFLLDLEGTPGANGLDGRSAYQVWLDQGNTGTEADFIVSLKGAKGDQGEVGPPAATTIAAKAAADLPSTYPEGISVMDIGAFTDWPALYGTTETVRFGTNRSFQTFVERTTAKSWRRTPDASDAGWLAWVEWGKQGPKGDPGLGFPAGGLADTVLTKVDGTDYNTAWKTIPSGVTDHGLLTGLADDDHTQYALADGTRGLFASTTHVHDFASITNKPATYPPDAHAHAFSEITNKPATYPPDTHVHPNATATTAGFLSATDKVALDGKADQGHTHAQSEITNLTTDLAGKAPAAAGTPIGGTAGQVLSKVDAVDHNTQWIDPPAGTGGQSVYNFFRVKYDSATSAWPFATLADAQTAGLVDGQTAWFVGPTGIAPPGWARTDDFWTEV